MQVKNNSRTQENCLKVQITSTNLPVENYIKDHDNLKSKTHIKRQQYLLEKRQFQKQNVESKDKKKHFRKKK